jgi:hypothetical protein
MYSKDVAIQHYMTITSINFYNSEFSQHYILLIKDTAVTNNTYDTDQRNVVDTFINNIVLQIVSDHLSVTKQSISFSRQVWNSPHKPPSSIHAK